jgi:hypothetical protein
MKKEETVLFLIGQGEETKHPSESQRPRRQKGSRLYADEAARYLGEHREKKQEKAT